MIELSAVHPGSGGGGVFMTPLTRSMVQASLEDLCIAVVTEDVVVLANLNTNRCLAEPRSSGHLVDQVGEMFYKTEVE